jgi:hypothetical protein
MSCILWFRSFWWAVDTGGLFSGNHAAFVSSMFDPITVLALRQISAAASIFGNTLRSRGCICSNAHTMPNICPAPRLLGSAYSGSSVLRGRCPPWSPSLCQLQGPDPIECSLGICLWGCPQSSRRYPRPIHAPYLLMSRCFWIPLARFKRPNQIQKSLAWHSKEPR